MPRNFIIEEGTATPSFPGIMLAIVIALKELGGQKTNAEIAKKIIDDEGMIEPEKSYTMGGGKTTKLTYYLRWSLSYLKYAGILENPAYGVWALTNAGQEITELAQTTAAHDRYLAYIAEINRQEEAPANERENPPVADEVNAPDGADWKANLLEVLGRMRHDAFEGLSCLLLWEAGFINVDSTTRGADGGIDGFGTLQTDVASFRVCIQCKRQQDTVGAPEIRDFRGALDISIDKGLFITNNSFTKPAKDEAEATGKIIIDLIDGDRLCDLLKQYNLGVQTLNGTTTPIQDFFDNL